MPNRDELRAVAEQGTAFYNAQLRSQLETPENVGKILVLDIDSGHHIVGTDHLTTLKNMKAQFPEARLYALRIGYPAVTKRGAWPISLTHVGSAK